MKGAFAAALAVVWISAAAVGHPGIARAALTGALLVLGGLIAEMVAALAGKEIGLRRRRGFLVVAIAVAGANGAYVAHAPVVEWTFRLLGAAGMALVALKAPDHVRLLIQRESALSIALPNGESYEAAVGFWQAAWADLHLNTISARLMFRETSGELETKFILAGAPERVEVLRAFAKGAFPDATFAEITGPTLAVEAALERWAEIDGAEPVLELGAVDYLRELPHLPNVIAYRLGFRQPGGGALPIAQGAELLGAVQPTIVALLRQPGFRGLELRADVDAVGDEEEKHPMSETKRAQVRTGDYAATAARTGSRAALSIGWNVALLALNLLVIVFSLSRAVPITLLYWLRRRRLARLLAWLLCAPAGEMRFEDRVIGCWPKRLAKPRWFRARPSEPVKAAAGSVEALATEKTKETDGLMGKKARERWLNARMSLIAYADQLTPEIEQAYGDVCSSVERISTHPTSHAGLVCEPIEDARAVIAGALTRRSDDTFTAGELASWLRPPDRSFTGQFTLDNTPVPIMRLPKEARAVAADLITLGIGAPGTEDKPVAFDRDDLEGHMLVLAEPRSGKSWAIAYWMAKLIALGEPVFALDPGGMAEGFINRALRILASADGGLNKLFIGGRLDVVSDERVQVVDWNRPGFTVYDNPLIVDNPPDPTDPDGAIDAAASNGLAVLRATTFGDLGAAAPRASGLLEAQARGLAEFNWAYRCWAVEHDVELKTLPRRNLADISLFLEHKLYAGALALFFCNEADRRTIVKVLKKEKESEFEDYVSPIVHRMNRLLAPRRLRRQLTSPFRRIDYADAIKNNRVILHNIPTNTGNQDEKAYAQVNLAIQFLAYTSAAQQVMTQLGRPKPSYMFIDEAPNLASVDPAAMETVITELGKTQARVVFVAQFLAQFAKGLYDAMLQVNNFVVMTSPKVPKELAVKFDPDGTEVRPETFSKLANTHGLARIKGRTPDGIRTTLKAFAFKVPFFRGESAEIEEAIAEKPVRGAELYMRPNALADEQAAEATRLHDADVALTRIVGSNWRERVVAEIPNLEAELEYAGVSEAALDVGPKEVGSADRGLVAEG